jgi:hypothetical protein
MTDPSEGPPYPPAAEPEPCYPDRVGPPRPATSNTRRPGRSPCRRLPCGHLAPVAYSGDGEVWVEWEAVA